MCCRTGWLEDEPCKPTGRLEYRPAAELGPVIVCLDTSGSMSGARETVAKVGFSLQIPPQRPPITSMVCIPQIAFVQDLTSFI